jgi:hypothetical protein
MKLVELSPVFEKFDNKQSSGITRKRLTTELFDMVFNAVKGHELNLAEISAIATEMQEKEAFDRTVGAAKFMLGRMHILVHGSAPQGMTEKAAETFFTPSAPMNAYAKTKGIDVGDSISKARIDLKNRKAKVKQKDATQMMSVYYKDNKAKLPTTKELSKHRNDIIKSIMLGMTPKEAFDRVIK